MFFKPFPPIYFEIAQNHQILVTDFLRAIKLDTQLKENPIFFKVYEIQDGDTPEIISHKFYGSTMYHWVLMLLNEKFDPWRDFPQPDHIVRKYAEEKYDDLNGIHHFEDVNGNWINDSGGLNEFEIPITNIEYELDLNERKRSIKILDKSILSEFVNEYTQLISI